MSSGRVKKSKQFFGISSYSYDTANGVINVTANGHNLFTGCPVYLTSDKSYEAYYATANVTSTNTFTVLSGVTDLQFLTNFAIDGYLGGPSGNLQIGNRHSHAIPRATGTDTVIQTYTNGAGGASILVDVSLDGSHWISFGSLTNGSADGNTVALTIKPGWAFYRANIQSIGANTNLVIMSGE
jgi:hypothetical protein